MAAASSGVRPSSSASGSSAQPSGTSTRYFTHAIVRCARAADSTADIPLGSLARIVHMVVARAHRAGRARAVARRAHQPAPTAAAATPAPRRSTLTRVASTSAALTAMAARTGDRDALRRPSRTGRVRAVRDGSCRRRRCSTSPTTSTRGRRAGAARPRLLPRRHAALRPLHRARNGDAPDRRVHDARAASPTSGSRATVLTVADPQPNHNGGQLAFGPDGYLYIGLGDGGAADDEGSGHARGGNGQSLDTLLGKILRIDPTPSGGERRTPCRADNPFVGRADARPEIWAYGLRNPWRFSFDRAPATSGSATSARTRGRRSTSRPRPQRRDAGKGVNFGWNRLEGNARVPRRGARRRDRARGENSHDDGWLLGHRRVRVPRRKIPPLRGSYLFTDYCSGLR